MTTDLVVFQMLTYFEPQEMKEEISPMSRGELADRLGISRSTLMRRMQEREIRLPNGLISPKDVVKICISLGWPVFSGYQELYESMRESGEVK